ncbi:pyruvate, water dikinase regulatory protein [Clostridium estertheticum]|uniref:pyruvate, water dikinase regulatory protein n=1 Tax=Clostridium estertheticum TaxID=238834 RepID=UPI001C0CC3F4|nr:pyruvate, water dikinase regulatory protein [Clostridium estertheticum]MBU3174445.1 kinase/pyrophosphorylase [Clostridium estertheticum]MBX4267354.1 kinase/pyrophosphorylase [Clostridium estertheticum]MBX4272133.1 kinase/pyrophosphorylase [Clostridium estertheticum]MCB2362072.1 kinase/pyrophosphorylase [Clostridium estertheticum]WLC79778.1 kinase/pyrophosphorylase [Clostridium estertheticum]
MLTIYAVSDSIGETAELVAKSVESQFPGSIIIKRVPYIKTAEDVNKFISKIEDNSKAMIISTIIMVDVKEFLVQRCVEKGVFISNILGPVIGLASKLLNKQPEYIPGAIWNMDKEYYKRIEAMEFAIQFDDSRDYNGIKLADVVLIGVSRTSKTPLCMYLANKGVKAINIPLVPEVPVPEELYNIPGRKIIGLTINPFELIEIRKHRMDKFSGLNSSFQYSNDARILDELDFAEKVMKKTRCLTIDVTKRAIEDTALIIMKSIGSTK